MTPHERLERWTAATLEGVLSDLAATHGGRNAALRDASIRIGALVRYGLVSEGEATQRLLDAAEANGYARKDGVRTALGTIRRGLRYGLSEADLPYEIVQLARGWTPPETTDAPELVLPELPPLPTTPPPADEVADLWERAGCVADDPDTRTWLEDRRIDVVAIADRDLARVLPEGPLPAWAQWGTREGAPTWRDTGHRLLVPLVDVRARPRSLNARAVVATSYDAPKSLAPAGYSRRGLVMADALARRILARRPAYLRARLLVVEGEKKFLLHASRSSDAAIDAPAVLAVDSGSWRDDSELGDAVPDGACVVIRTDPDKDGARYATDILRSLEDRWRRALVRVELREGLDVAFAPELVVSAPAMEAAHV